MLLDFRYEKAYTFNNLIKCEFCNFILLTPPPPYLGYPEPSLRSLSPPPLCTPLSELRACQTISRSRSSKSLDNISHLCQVCIDWIGCRQLQRIFGPAISREMCVKAINCALERWFLCAERDGEQVGTVDKSFEYFTYIF